MLSNFVWLLCTVGFYADSASIIDQRQNGELNVQVDLKDFEIIALLKKNKEEYVDYDYAYDYSEMTIKPQNGTTAKPLNVTSSAADSVNFTTASTLMVLENQTMSTQESFQNDTSAATFNPVGYENATELTNKYETSTAAPCKKGFINNTKGECELKLHNTGNTLLKLVKLSQKLKQRRENRRSNKPV